MIRYNKKKNILIIGAGAAGKIIGNEIQQRQLGNLIGFLDDDPEKSDLLLCNRPVLGTIQDVKAITSTHNVQQVIIAIPSAVGQVFRNIIGIINGLNVDVKIVPGYFDLQDHDVRILYPIRELEISDLLGRPHVELDTEAISSYIKGKTVLITGAGGSIGSEISRLVAGLKPKNLICLGRGENSIFKIVDKLKYLYPETKITPVITNVTNLPGLKAVFRDYKPSVVFHTASHKHVTLMEESIHEAFLNNVIGTRNVTELSHQFGVEKFVQISTDKAVNPISIMGITKKITELMVLSFTEESRTIFSAVRFGNVLDSRGSVVQTFKKQIERGGPLTVRDKNAFRFFMSIPEASQLVLQSAALAKGGEIFVLDMGEPIKILDLANQIIKLSGLQAGKDIDIEFTHLEEGEKISEKLFDIEEEKIESQYPRIYYTPPKEVSKADLFNRIIQIEENLYSYTIAELRSILLSIIEQFSKISTEKKTKSEQRFIRI